MSRDRAIGPVGRAARLVIGVVVVIVVAMATDPIGWWDVAAVLTAFPVIAVAAVALVNTGYARFAPDALTRARAPWSGSQFVATAMVVAVVVGLGTALTFVTPVDRVAIFVFLGVSCCLLRAAATRAVSCSRSRT
ncbi:MAG: hypothetical protein ACRDWI_16285 [Jiangellaceae bacterium]